MNRLVILGNGFDLAHGLPTLYSDFVLDCFNEAFKNLNNYSNGYLEYNSRLFKLTSKYTDLNSRSFDSMQQVWEFIKYHDPGIVVEYIRHDSFFKKILNTYKISNWVDFEMAYYEELKDQLFIQNNNKSTESIKNLNIEFENIRNEFSDYLKVKIINQYQAIEASQFSDIFFREIEDTENRKPEGKLRAYPTEICFLNFNYTNTIDTYLENKESNRFAINIHGRIGDSENEIVFGYGDELDQKFKEIENFNDNSLLQNFKSYWYHRTNNYSKLLGFLDRNYFQIYVVGHSCGLSDRTLLNYIFEHNNCTSIRFFHHGGQEGYLEQVMNASRHFKDKNLQRKRIISFNRKGECPQVTWLKKSQ